MRRLYLAIALALAVTACASTGSGKVYTNSQFAKSDDQILVVTNDGAFPKTVYARFVMPNDPDNRNYGFMQTIAPGNSIQYYLPAGTGVYACDGKYWDSYRPKEKSMGTVRAGETLSFAASEFRP